MASDDNDTMTSSSRDKELQRVLGLQALDALDRLLATQVKGEPLPAEEIAAQLRLIRQALHGC
jgi:hypothetical protein